MKNHLENTNLQSSVMIKYILLLFLISSTSLCYSQKKSSLLKDTLVWKADDPLTREDFKAKSKGNYYGLTSSAILLTTKEEDGTIKFVVKAVFFRSRSSLKYD